MSEFEASDVYERAQAVSENSPLASDVLQPDPQGTNTPLFDFAAPRVLEHPQRNNEVRVHYVSLDLYLETPDVVLELDYERVIFFRILNHLMFQADDLHL